MRGWRAKTSQESRSDHLAVPAPASAFGADPRRVLPRDPQWAAVALPRVAAAPFWEGVKKHRPS